MASGFFRYLAAGTITAGLALGAAQAGPYSALVVFGDSLSDTGNVQLATGLAQPQIGSSTALPPGQVGYANGQWTDNQGNGVWVNTVAQTLGVGSAPSLAGGSNYAWAGARTGTNPSATGAWYLNQQVASYLTNSGGTANGSALYAILIGGNDIAAIIGDAAASPGTASTIVGAGVTAGISSIATQVQTLYAAGARNFLLFNAPDVLPTPRFQSTLASLPDNAARAGLTFVANSTTNAWNAAFNTAVLNLRNGLTGEDIDTVDLFGSGSATLANLAAFGYDGSTAPCYISANAICADPRTRYFWDPFHPGSTVHTQVAGLALAAIPLPGVAMLLALGLGLGLVMRRRAA